MNKNTFKLSKNIVDETIYYNNLLNMVNSKLKDVDNKWNEFKTNFNTIKVGNKNE